MTYPALSVTTRSVLRELDEQDRVRSSRYTDTRRYELPNVESRTAGSDCSYQSDPADSVPRGMSS